MVSVRRGQATSIVEELCHTEASPQSLLWISTLVTLDVEDESEVTHKRSDGRNLWTVDAADRWLR